MYNSVSPMPIVASDFCSNKKNILRRINTKGSNILNFLSGRNITTTQLETLRNKTTTAVQDLFCSGGLKIIFDAGKIGVGHGGHWTREDIIHNMGHVFGIFE